MCTYLQTPGRPLLLPAGLQMSFHELTHIRCGDNMETRKAKLQSSLILAAIASFASYFKHSLICNPIKVKTCLWYVVYSNGKGHVRPKICERRKSYLHDKTCKSCHLSDLLFILKHNLRHMYTSKVCGVKSYTEARVKHTAKPSGRLCNVIVNAMSNPSLIKSAALNLSAEGLLQKQMKS